MAIGVPIVRLIAQSSGTLTTARSIAAHVAPKEADPAPVRLEATVTFQDPSLTIFLRDDTGATFVRAARDNPRVKPGDRLRIAGVTHKGLFIGGIAPDRIERLGDGPPVDPLEVTADDLASGGHHYEWVRVSGVGRMVNPSGENGAVMQLLVRGKNVELRFDEAPPEPRALVDAELRVRGLAAGDINDRRQLLQPYVRVRNGDDVEIVKAPPADPFAAEPVPFGELQRASAADHRIKIRGTALGPPVAGGLHFRDRERSVFVQTAFADVKAGDIVEAAGFPQMGVFSAELTDAECRVVGTELPPPALEVTAKELANGCDADLIRTEVRVLQRLDRGSTVELLAQIGSVGLTVVGPESLSREVQAGSMVRVTGLCRVTGTRSDSYRAKASAYRIWLRDSGDLLLLERAPWWTPQRLGFGLAIAGSLAGAALAWIGLLRRQVAKQTAQIHLQAQGEAVSEERRRIAREFHDTLEQELAGLTLRLDAAATRVTDDKARSLLEQQRRLLSRLQTETRDFVWDLRDPSRQDAPLPEALQALVEQLQAGAAMSLRLNCDPGLPELPPLMRHHLLRIAREAMHNAIKYSGARFVELSVSARDGRLRFAVADDGTGFEPAAADALEGHFGIQGMRERARKIGADIVITSRSGDGTRVELTLDLPAQKA